MLTLARKHEDDMGDKLGYRNFEFRKARIQDMALDLEMAEAWLKHHPIHNVEQLSAFDAYCLQPRREHPLIADYSVDVVVSNCVLNLVKPDDKAQLFGEMYRVLKHGGRAVISDVVCDEDPTPAILNDAKLWSGCIAGAFREDRFLEMFEQAGFYGIEILTRQEKPWQVIDGIEFRSATVRAFKGKEGPYLERWYKTQSCECYVKPTPHISVIIPTLNEAATLPEAIRSIRRIKRTEVIVVDGDGRLRLDRSPATSRTHWHRLVGSHHLGPTLAEGRNPAYHPGSPTNHPGLACRRTSTPSRQLANALAVLIIARHPLTRCSDPSCRMPEAH